PPVSLNLSPNRLQFFSGDSVSLSCVEGGQTVDGTVRRTRGGTTDRCGPAGSDFGLFQDSSCVLDLLSSYTGLYWCETSSGRSDRVQISVFHREEFPFILEIPAHPVTAGSDVTLRCRNKDGSLRAAYFLKNNAATGDGLKVQELSIRAVQRSDEGLYSCSTDVSEPSPQSWLRVREPTGTSAPPSTTSGTSPPPDVPSLPTHPASSVLAPAALGLVVVLVLVLVLVGLLQLCKKPTGLKVYS
ncbi:uncharacterized protein LOC114843652, partial [Betta splendens]|uniref:Uncharacterized protein LOC114843652 n=1 Tax=Betta splendens TaxID=158456 RepID=A0A6P7KZZ7_BETSP